MVEWLFLAVPWGCLRFVVVVLPDHTHLLFLCPLDACDNIIQSLIAITCCYESFLWFIFHSLISQLILIKSALKVCFRHIYSVMFVSLLLSFSVFCSFLFGTV